MNVLITGAAGVLGAHLVARLFGDHRVRGTDRHAWWGDQSVHFMQGDLTNDAFMSNVIGQCGPDVLIHCAGMVDVDACERHPKQAFMANAEIVRRLVSSTSAECLFVYISTDSVFSGESSFWKESDQPCPINIYARSKLQGEYEAAKAQRYLIIRTNFYGWSAGRKRTSAEWQHDALTDGAPLTLFDDFFITPIYVADLARSIQAIIDTGVTGLLHVCGRDRVSKYEYGSTMARLMGLSMRRVRRGSLLSAGLDAPRPKDISLSTEKVRTLLGVDQPGCEEGLARFLTDRGKPLSQR